MASRTQDRASRAALAVTLVLLGGLAFREGVERATVRPLAALVAPFDPATLEDPEVPEEPLIEPPTPPPGWDLSNLAHPRVDYWVSRFQTDKREKFEGFLARKGRFEPMIRAKLRERGMPQDLLYLAMVESGFQTNAYSRAHAAGLWQFIAETGSRYGLDINRAVDERNDPVKATDAALRYLKDLHRRFGSWYLAAAAYNTGENRVERVMRQSVGRRHGTDVDYYRVWDRLPAETRDYVPLMIAAARIAKDPVAYGFHVQPLPAWSYEETTAAPATPLSALARRSGTSVAAIRELNPQLKTDRTRNDRPTRVRVPLRRTPRVKAAPVGVLEAD